MRIYTSCCDTGICFAGAHEKLVSVREVANWLCKLSKHELAALLIKNVNGIRKIRCDNCNEEFH